MTARLSGGRFGPVYAGRDPVSGSPVIIRTFDDTMTVERQAALVDALTRLCERQLVHPSIARALACGVEGTVPYVVHAALPGVTVDEYLATLGPRPMSEVATRVAQLAVAIDFADASGLHHGALGPRDIAIQPGSSGISGFGLAQAVRAAGVDTNEPSLADDIYALGSMAFELMLGHRYDGRPIRTAVAGLSDMPAARLEALARALESALSPDMRLWPSAASEFAESLSRAVPSASAAAAALRTHVQPADPGGTVGRLALGADDTRIAQPRAPLPTAASSPSPLDLTLFDAPSPVGREAALPDAALRTSVAIPAAGPGLFRSDADREAGDRRPLLRVVAFGGLAAAVLVGALALGGWFRRDALVTPDPPEAPRVAVAAPEVALDPTPDAPDAPAEPAAPAAVAADPSPAPMPRPSATEPVPTPRQDAAPPARSPASAPPRPNVAPPAPSQASVPGRLLVRSTPAGAIVVVDGQPRGRTPLAVRGLDLGAHTITVTGDGLPPWERRVELTVERPALSFDVGGADADGLTGPAAPARSGILQIDSRPPGAGVWLDGELAGKTPLSLSEVRPGSYDVRIELPGYRPWVTSVALAAGARVRVAASLER